MRRSAAPLESWAGLIIAISVSLNQADTRVASGSWCTPDRLSLSTTGCCTDRPQPLQVVVAHYRLCVVRLPNTTGCGFAGAREAEWYAESHRSPPIECRYILARNLLFCYALWFVWGS